MSPTRTGETLSLRSNNKNVYILGAGFSVDAGLPTIADFLNQMRDGADWLAEHRRDRELSAVERVLTFRHEAAAAGYRVNVDLDNIEDLFSLAAALPQMTVSREVQAAIGATLNYAQVRSSPSLVRLRVSPARGWALTDKWRDSAKRVDQAGPDSFDVLSSIYDSYASLLAGRTSKVSERNQNVVITFNYDLLLEAALERLGIPFSYGLGSEHVTYDPAAIATPDLVPDGLLLLKMHGSLNWGLTEPGCLTVYATYDDTVSMCELPHLVPPTWEKTVAGPTAAVWRRAVEELRGATRLVIVGFSFRATDAHFKYLLAAGLMGNSSLRRIVVVNPKATELASQIRNVLRGDQFEYGMISLRDSTVREFFRSPDGLSGIGRPMLHEGLDLVDAGGPYLERRLFVQ
jgi:hypothetical protein